MPSTHDVTIIGAGLAGLACAKSLSEQGLSYIVLESSDQIGGRVRTDRMNGFLLDHGFQVFLTAYPEAQRVLDYTKLNLQPFFSGARVRYNHRFYTIANPYQHPWESLQSFFGPIGTWKDKWRILQLQRKTASLDFSETCPPSDTNISHLLGELGFSEEITSRIFRPFFGGVFSDWDLHTSQTIFEFVFSMFSQGKTAVPANGMGAIPEQLASSLSSETIRTQTTVRSIHHNEVELESGERVKSKAVIIATEQPEAGRLMNSKVRATSQKSYCLYYAAKEPPINGPFLLLNGDGLGSINHLSVISQVAPSYAPQDCTLISVTVLNHKGPLETLDQLVRQDLFDWFGPMVKDWRHLQTYSNQHTASSPHAVERPMPSANLPGSNVFLCGDYFHSPTHHGALLSGRKIAESVMAI